MRESGHLLCPEGTNPDATVHALVMVELCPNPQYLRMGLYLEISSLKR